MTEALFALSAVLAVGCGVTLWALSDKTREARQQREVIDSQAAEIRRQSEDLARLRVALKAAQNNDGRDPKTGHYTGAVKECE